MTRPGGPARQRHRPGGALAAAAAVLLAACHGNPSPPPPLPPPEGLVVSTASLVTTEGGIGASFDALLASTPAATVEVEVLSTDATEGLVFADGYAGPGAAHELTFTPQDWNVPRRVVVQPADDHVADGSVTYPVILRVAYSEDAGYAALPGVEVRVTNLDDDAPGIVVVPEGGTPLRTDEDGATASFTIWLACAPAGNVEIPVTVGDATEGLVRGGSSPYFPVERVTVTFTPTSWDVPQTVTVVGVADGITDDDQSYFLTIGPSTGDATFASVAAQTVGIVNADIEPTPVATYDSTLRAPRCASVFSGCDSGSLLDGRGPSEPNQPNTISSSCADGASGTYHVEESLDALHVRTLDGSSFAPGKLVRVDATVWVYSATSNYLDLYGAADANAPAWTYIGTFSAAGSGRQVVTAEYVLPSGTLQALRGVWRYGAGAPASCAAGSYDDHDDLVFAVAP